MVNVADISDALKAKLDSDTALDTLLGISETGSKVFIGVRMPEFIAPAIQLIVTTNEATPETNHASNEMTLLVNVYSREMADGTMDSDELEGIIQRCFILLHHQSITVAGHAVHSIYTEGRDEPIPHREREKIFFGGLRCRMFATKY